MFLVPCCNVHCICCNFRVKRFSIRHGSHLFLGDLCLFNAKVIYLRIPAYNTISIPGDVTWLMFFSFIFWHCLSLSHLHLVIIHLVSTNTFFRKVHLPLFCLVAYMHYRRERKPKLQARMDNPGTLATLDIRYRTKTTTNMIDTLQWEESLNSNCKLERSVWVVKYIYTSICGISWYITTKVWEEALDTKGR